MERNRRAFLNAQQKSILISNLSTPHSICMCQTLNLVLQLPWIRSKSPQSKLRRLALWGVGVWIIGTTSRCSRINQPVTFTHSSDAHCTDAECGRRFIDRLLWLPVWALGTMKDCYAHVYGSPAGFQRHMWAIPESIRRHETFFSCFFTGPSTVIIN